MNALAYLLWTSARNRARSLLSRVRSPRYAAALIVGVAYIYFFLLHPVNTGAATPMLLGRPTEMVVTALAFLTLTSSWIFGADSTALAFSQAEVSMLFPAPLSRRSLIAYKLTRAQLAVLINALVWIFILRRGGSPLSPWLRALSLWVMFSTLNLHRLCAALVRSSWREHGRSGLRRQQWSIAVFALLATAVIVGLVQHGRALANPGGIGGFFTALGTALSSAPASWGLYPVHLIVAPTFASTTAEWLRAFGPAAAILVAHTWWVFRTDRAFEEAAIEATAERARRLEAARARRSAVPATAPTRATSTIALASTGHPGLALLWKNTLCLRRTAQLRLFIGPLAMAIVLGGALSADGDVFAMISTSALMLAALLLVFGGRLIRNDLRQDMQHLPMLKTLPVDPGVLVGAEVASSALPMAAVQLLLLVIAYVAGTLTPYALFPKAIRTGVIAAAPLAVLALNTALMTIQNGIVVLFPNWVRLGTTVSTGVEALGQNVLATAANLGSLGVSLLLPALAGFGVLQLFGRHDAPSVALAVSAGALVLGAEMYGMLCLLGRSFAKAEPV